MNLSAHPHQGRDGRPARPSATPSPRRLGQSLLTLAVIASSTLLLSGCFNNPMPQATSPVAAMMAGAKPAVLEPAPAPRLDPALLKPSDTVFHVGPGDELELEVMGDPASRAKVTVGPDGKVYYYLLPGTDVWGLTLPQVRDRLSEEMKKYVREKPVVSVTLRSVASQRVWVLGRVTSPGIFTLTGPTTLLDALAQAGGLSASSPYAAFAASLGVPIPPGGPAEAADLGHSFVIRRGQVLPVDFKELLRDGNLSQNIYLQPDDFVFLPSVRTPQVHILGAVNQPHSERMAGSLTVIQAIALCAGTAPQACLENVAILRGSMAQPQIAIVRVDQILKGQTPDVKLEPGDILYVPYNPERIMSRYVNLILDTFARTVGINAGARIVSGNSTPIGIGVTVSPR